MRGHLNFKKYQNLLNILNLMPILAFHLYMSIIAEGPRTSHKTQVCRKRKGQDQLNKVKCINLMSQSIHSFDYCQARPQLNFNSSQFKLTEA